MKPYFVTLLLLMFFFRCKKEEIVVLPPVFNIDVTLNSVITPKPDKIRVVLNVGRSHYNFLRSQNPAGNPDVIIKSSLFATFWQDLNTDNKAFFKDTPIEYAGITYMKNPRNDIYLYDTLFIRLEARQIIGKDTLFKNNDLNPASIVFPRDIKGNTTVNRSVNVTL